MFKKCFYVFLLTPMMLLVGCNKGNNVTLEEPLNFTCTEGEVSVGYDFDYDVDDEPGYTPKLEWSKDKKTWNKITIKECDSIAVIKKNQTIYFRGDNPKRFNCHTADVQTYFYFNFLGVKDYSKLNISGNIMSLMSSENFASKKEIPSEGYFASLFTNDYSYSSLTIDASKLLLPATKLEKYAYLYLFNDSNVVKAPLELPAEEAKQGCYEGMFEDADSLITAPIIRLKTLEESSCYEMFYGCSSLYVSKNKGKTNFFTCPAVPEGKSSTEWMFFNTKGDCTEDDPQQGEVFYYN